MADKQFVNGIRIFKPNANAPEFIIADMEFTKSELIEFLKSQPDKFKVQVKLSQKGTYYLEVNTWQPKAHDKLPADKEYKKATGYITPLKEPADDLPF